MALFSTLILLPRWSCDAEIPPVPEYQVGDAAEASVITPVALSVADQEATRRLREKAAQQMPPVFRFYPMAAEEAEAEFQAAIRREHEVFLAAVQQCYRLNRLNEPTVNHASFGKFMAWLKKQHRSFPNATNLAKAWAMGDSGEKMVKELEAKLRQAMKHYIQTNELQSEEGEAKPETIRVFTAKSDEAIPVLEVVESRSQLVPRHECYTLAEARAELAKSFSALDQPLAEYLGAFLKENCLYDPHLTERLQKKKTADLWAFIHYEPGEVIVRTGETVDANAKAALDALADKRNAEQKKAAAAQLEDENGLKNGLARYYTMALTKLENAEPAEYALWIALIGLLLVLLLLVRSRKQARATAPAVAASPMAYTVILNPERNETIFLPVKQGLPQPPAVAHAQSPTPALPEGQPARPALSEAQPVQAAVPEPVADPDPDPEIPIEPPAEPSWTERARDAEERAKELLAMVRAGLAPHLAKHLMNRLVQELLVQRSSLLQTQQVAGQELGAIEARFTAIYQQLQEQLRNYQQRTQALEGKLADKDQANSELLKAMILTQKKLQSTQSGNTGI